MLYTEEAVRAGLRVRDGRRVFYLPEGSRILDTGDSGQLGIAIFHQRAARQRRALGGIQQGLAVGIHCLQR